MRIIKIKGNIESIRQSMLDEIESLYDMEASRDEFLPQELALKLACFTGRINREIAVYLNRKGNVVDICIGDNTTVSLPEVEGRRDEARLSGIRCIHTHPNGDGRLSTVDINSLITLRLDAMAAIGVKDGNIIEAYAALPVRDDDGKFSKADIFGPFSLKNGRINGLLELINEIDKAYKSTTHINETGVEKAILVALERSAGKIINGKSQGERSLEELEELALTAGVTVLEKILQKKSSRDASYYIGKGMTEHISLLRQELDADVVIFDDELSGAQVRNIENVVGIKVIDRTMLILDIFAQRARSKEGKLQVELAQLKYRLPRLMGLGTQLSRLGGGIGTRGPGEKKLEVDRRHIKRRISYLEEELESLSKRRGLMRDGRRKNAVPAIALVGYTNVGKSTLMNKLCSSDVFAENKLFATLDPTTRSLMLPNGKEVLLIDTVGFIRKLPHELIEAFKSTLEEAVFADVLLHVADISTDEAEEQIQVVNEILHELGALNKPSMMVLNKVDLMGEAGRIPIASCGEKYYEISAVTGYGLDSLLDGIAEVLHTDDLEVNINAPYNEGWILPYVYENGEILEKNYTETGTQIKALMKKSKIEKIRKYVE